ncbi:MAG: Dam family site-specific DNA-(adenine-N6)-methyltransferase [Chitinophagaceae bacterium]
MSEGFRRPCLRWPGNKYSLLSKIFEFVPEGFKNYHEPFLGSGSVFLNIEAKGKYFLSDCSPALMNFYMQVKNNLPTFLSILSIKENTTSFYYLERERVYKTSIERAAQLYYLNRTCFNGIYRVNSYGKFNVPYGYRANFDIVDRENLTRLRNKLKRAVLNTCDFKLTDRFMKTGDFVFLDPPYSAMVNNSKFLMYNETLFSWSDQLRLQEFCRLLIKRRIRFVMTNLYNSDIFNLFGKGLKLNCTTVERISRVGSKSESRGLIKEYLFSNSIL